MASKIIARCGCCGRRIQPHQAKLEVKVRKGISFFHETWEGCYESTRESDRVYLSDRERTLQQLSVTMVRGAWDNLPTEFPT